MVPVRPSRTFFRRTEHYLIVHHFLVPHLPTHPERSRADRARRLVYRHWSRMLFSADEHGPRQPRRRRYRVSVKQRRSPPRRIVLQRRIDLAGLTPHRPQSDHSAWRPIRPTPDFPGRRYSSLLPLVSCESFVPGGPATTPPRLFSLVSLNSTALASLSSSCRCYCHS